MLGLGAGLFVGQAHTWGTPTEPEAEQPFAERTSPTPTRRPQGQPPAATPHREPHPSDTSQGATTPAPAPAAVMVSGGPIVAAALAEVRTGLNLLSVPLAETRATARDGGHFSFALRGLALSGY